MQRGTYLLGVIALTLTIAAPAPARDWFVSAARGKGKKGTVEEPAKDLGNISSRLEDGDVVHIAEGYYTGRGDNGCDQIDKVVSIYGGYADDFSMRDPWGAHKTILGGTNTTENWVQGGRLSIDLTKRRDLRGDHKVVVDGLIIDHGYRNRYNEGETKIIMMADPKTGKNPTPGFGGLSVAVWKEGDIEIRNCIVLNTAPRGSGAIAAWGHEHSEVIVENNLAANNTGYGLFCHSSFHPDEVERMPQFVVRNNTLVFNSKQGPGDSDGGSALRMDSPTRITADHNVFALSDFYGVDNSKQAKEFALNNNLFVSNLRADYIEFDTKMNVDELEDESDLLDEAEGNIATDRLRPKVSQKWAAAYMSRTIVDRNAAEADIEAVESGVNELRSILGLPLQAADQGEYSDAWLPRMSLEDAIIAGGMKVLDQYGCSMPAPQPVSW